MTSLFIGHGSPFHAFSDNRYRSKWEELEKALPVPSAILVISAHWLTNGIFVTGSGELKTLHDFYGFPSEYYDFHYPARGSEFLERRVRELIPEVQVDNTRGLDHGAWAILKNMYPKANVPVMQLSLNLNFNLKAHMDLAEKLKSLLKENILIIGSGNVVHNLERLNPVIDYKPYCWAQSFEMEIKKALLNNDEELLKTLPYNITMGGPLSAPTLEHYIPLLYNFVLRDKHSQIEFPLEGIIYGSLSMLSFFYR